MMRRLNVCTICLVFGLSILLIINIGSQSTEKAFYLTPIESRRNFKIIIKVEDGEETYSQQIPIVLYGGYHGSKDMDNVLVTTNENHSYEQPDIKHRHTNRQNATHSSTDIEKMLEKARTKIKDDFSNYNFSQTGVHSLEDLVIESGGQPLRTLIISSWRSGSTFIGDLVNAVPGTYYHYEPLLMFGIKQITDPREATKPLSMVKQMFKCNFYDLEDYFEFESKDLNLFSHRTRLYDYCQDENRSELCFNAEFTSRFCKLFPFHSMKLVRLRLRPVEAILNDKELNVKVILLVRDPRGVMQSRRHAHFCRHSPDCWDPYLVCADMVSDYVEAGQILQKYPDRLMVMRFEDLALKPNVTTDRILKFLRLDGRQVFDKFLQLHTTFDLPGFQSTSKLSRKIPYKWKTDLAFSSVNEVQMACREAMRVWGYKLAHNETHMTSKDFNPIGDYTI